MAKHERPQRQDDPLVIYSDGRPPVLRRDVMRDNTATMRREYLTLDGRVGASEAADEVEQRRARGDRIEPWGTYLDAARQA